MPFPFLFLPGFDLLTLWMNEWIVDSYSGGDYLELLQELSNSKGLMAQLSTRQLVSAQVSVSRLLSHLAEQAEESYQTELA